MFCAELESDFLETSTLFVQDTLSWQYTPNIRYQSCDLLFVFSIVSPNLHCIHVYNTQEIYTQEINTQEIHKQKIHTKEIHTQEIYTHEKFTIKKYTQEIHKQKIHTKEIHTQEIYTHEKFTIKKYTSKKYTHTRNTHRQMFRDATLWHAKNVNKSLPDHSCVSGWLAWLGEIRSWHSRGVWGQGHYNMSVFGLSGLGCCL